MFWKAGDCILQNRSKIVKGENSDKWKFIFNLTLPNRILILSKDNKKIKDQRSGYENKERHCRQLVTPVYGKRIKKIFKIYFTHQLRILSGTILRIISVPIVGADKTMPNVSCNGITLVNFGMGSPNAATILDLLSTIEPEAVLFIGKCGGIGKKNSVGDYILPIAAIKGEGTSDATIICLTKCLPYRLSAFKKPVRRPSESWAGILYRRSLRRTDLGMGIRRSF